MYNVGYPADLGTFGVRMRWEQSLLIITKFEIGPVDLPTEVVKVIKQLYMSNRRTNNFDCPVFYR